MTSIGWEVVGTNNQELQIAKTVGDALRDLIRKRYRNNAAKTIERDWDLDPRTARNVVTQGNVSERTLTKALRAEGWPLIEALGVELTGETYAQFEERQLTAIMNEAENARQDLCNRRRARAALVEISRHLDALDDRQAAVGGRGRERGSWPADHELGHRETRGQAPAQKREG